MTEDRPGCKPQRQRPGAASLVWPFPPFPNPHDRSGLPPGPDKYTPGDDDAPAPY
jgi:hypothetical protein